MINKDELLRELNKRQTLEAVAPIFGLKSRASLKYWTDKYGIDRKAVSKDVEVTYVHKLKKNVWHYFIKK